MMAERSRKPKPSRGSFNNTGPGREETRNQKKKKPGQKKRARGPKNTDTAALVHANHNEGQKKTHVRKGAWGKKETKKFQAGILRQHFQPGRQKKTKKRKPAIKSFGTCRVGSSNEEKM